MNREIEELRKELSKVKSIQDGAYAKKLWEQKNIFPLREKLKILKGSDKELSNRFNFLIKESQSLFSEFKETLLYKREIKKLDLSINNEYLSYYCFNPLSEIKSILIDFFHKFNFEIESGDEIVSVKENFEDLNIPEDHPSRSSSDTFYLDDEYLLRPHCTVNSVRFLKKHIDKNFPACCATIGKVYRNDRHTARHIHQFTQLDFVWVDKNLNLGNLKWFLSLLCEVLFESKRDIRFRNSYFPFTQPSYEVDVRCSCNRNVDCNICSGLGWIEILGAGMLRRKILNEANFSEDYQGLAGGLGLERIALIKYEISDIRQLYENNFEFLEDDR